MIRPFDHQAFDLGTKILKHRFATVKTDARKGSNDSLEVLKRLRQENDELRETFFSQKRSWVDWCWPVTVDRQVIDDNTPVPPVNAEYEPLVDYDGMDEKSSNESNVVKGSAVQPIWDSFVSQPSVCLKASSGHRRALFLEEPPENHRRLSIFIRLGFGEEICQNRSPPHITKCGTTPKNAVTNSQSERCWKSLLEKDSVREKGEGGNEWSIVQEHFQNSRSTKVLGIIQN